MGFFDFLKPKKKASLYTGGDGASMETAVIINATSPLLGIAAEYRFIEMRCGRKDKNWERVTQMVMRLDNTRYDLIVVKLKNGDERPFYFDITEFYGSAFDKNVIMSHHKNNEVKGD